MSTHWILVADASRARVLSALDGAGELRLVHDLDYPPARRRSQELVNDEPGRINKGGRGVLSAMDPRTDPHEQQARQFAVKLAGLLDQAASRHAYTRLTLFAPAHFLGLLKSSLSAQARLAGCLATDLTRLKLPELSQRLKGPCGLKHPCESESRVVARPELTRNHGGR